MWIINHKMKVVRHETPRRNVNTISDKLIFKQAEHSISIFIIFEDANAAITARNNVIIARQRNYSTRSWHIALPSRNPAGTI